MPTIINKEKIGKEWSLLSESPEGTSAADTLILDFWPLELLMYISVCRFCKICRFISWGGVGASQNSCLRVILLLLRAFSVWCGLRGQSGAVSCAGALVFTPCSHTCVARRSVSPPSASTSVPGPASRSFLSAGSSPFSLSIPFESPWLVRRGPSHQREALLRREVRCQRSFWCWGWTPGLGCGAQRSGPVGVEVPRPSQELRG